MAPTGIIVYALHSVVLTESSIALSQLAASIFCLVVSMPPSGCPFYVLPALPPVVRGLPARPSARAEKLSPASTTRIQLQWLHSRRKLYNICTNNLPAIVTTTLNRPGFPGECFICELRLPDHRFRWKHNKLFLLLPEEYGPAFPAIVDCYTSPPTLVWPVPLLHGFSSSYGVLPPLCKDH